MLEEELVHAPDVILGHAALERHDRVVEGVIALLGRHVLQAQIPGMDRGQDARHHDLGVHFGAEPPHFLHHLVEVGLHGRKTAARKFQRIEIHLQIEARQLIDDPVILAQRKDFLGQRGRLRIAIHKEEFLLGTDALDVGFKHPAVEHVLERPHVLHDVPGEAPDLRSILTLRDVL